MTGLPDFQTSGLPNKKNMFDYIQNIRSHHTVPCTAEILHTVMRSTIVGMTCAEIADCHE